MSLNLTNEERMLLDSVRAGVRRIAVFKVGLYPQAVSLETVHGQWLTFNAREVPLAPRFEVFPLSVTEGLVEGVPAQAMETPEFASGCSVAILEKAEWDFPAAEEENKDMPGGPRGATIQSEGKANEAPAAALHSVLLHAGVELESSQGRRFTVATSMFPFALYVSDCDFSEEVPEGLYEREAVR